MEHYRERNISDFILSGSSYDAIWAMALGVDHATEMIKTNNSSGCSHLPGKLVSLENFDYHNQLMGCVLRKSFHQVNFTGITVSYKGEITSYIRLYMTVGSKSINMRKHHY